MQLTHPLIVHAEFMTHCMFARNASSSRAIPFSVMVLRVDEDPYIPRTFGQNQKGMQPAEPLTGWRLDRARELGLDWRDEMVRMARELASTKCHACRGSGKRIPLRPDGTVGIIDIQCEDCHGTGDGLNIHKQIVNRLIAPWGWITCAVTGTWDAWSNYFALRCHHMAQEAIYDQAMMAQKAYFLSRPNIVSPGGWHTPYMSYEDAMECANSMEEVKVSTGRCARTSLLTQEGKRDLAEDIGLHDRLTVGSPMHASPLEHVCQAMGDGQRYGKYVGWKAYRHMLPGEYITDFKPNHPELVDNGDGTYREVLVGE
jgi:hypothetical protein